MWKYLFSIFCLGANIHCYAELVTTNHFVSPTAQLKSDILPETPKNIPLPAFGQRIIGWGTGAEGARQRLENIQPAKSAKPSPLNILLWTDACGRAENKGRFSLMICYHPPISLLSISIGVSIKTSAAEQCGQRPFDRASRCGRREIHRCLKKRRYSGAIARLKKELAIKEARVINNATLMGYRTYRTGVDALAKLLAACGEDWPRFWKALEPLRSDPSRHFPKEQMRELDSVIPSTCG